MKVEKFKVLLYLKKSGLDKNGKAPIMGRITLNRTMAQFGCKLSCTPKLWNPRESRLDGKSKEAVEVNAKIDKLLLAINSAYESLVERKTDFDAKAIKDLFQCSADTQMTLLKQLDAIIADIESRIGIDYKKGTLPNYQYTRTVEQADPDPETASAFIEMAAHLVEMKSFLLLPRSEEGERMKQELTGQLIEYDQCRRMAALLRAKGEAAPVFVRRPMEMELDNTYALHHAPQILADYWQALAGRTRIRRVPTQQQFEPLVTAPMVSVTSRVVYILRRMLGGTVAKMEQLFSRSQSRSTNVATFLALLELVRGGRIALDDRGALTMRRTRPERNKENP